MEMVVSLTILAILIAMAVPLFVHQRDSRNLDTGERELSAMFVYARQTAVSQGLTTQLAITGTGTAISTSTSRLQIAQPQVTLSIPSTGQVLQRVTDIAANISLQVPLDQNSNNVTTITFASNGTVSSPTAFTTNGAQSTTGVFALACASVASRTWSLVTTTGGVLQQQ